MVVVLGGDAVSHSLPDDVDGDCLGCVGTCDGCCCCCTVALFIDSMTVSAFVLDDDAFSVVTARFFFLFPFRMVLFVPLFVLLFLVSAIPLDKVNNFALLRFVFEK